MRFRGIRFLCLLGVFALGAITVGVASGSAGATQASGTPIKIGYLAQSGVGPTAADEVPAFAAWVKWINAHGGINGHPAQLISEQEPGNVAIAETDAQKLVGDGIVALIDADANDVAWAPIVEKAGIPVYLTQSSDSAFAGSTDAFSPFMPLVASPAAQLLAAKKIGATNMALLYCTEFSQCKQAVPFYTALGKTYGVTVLFNTAISQSAPNYVAPCLASKQAGANSLLAASTADVAQRVVADCAKQGYTPHLVSSAGAFQQSFAGSKGTNGMIASETTVPFFDTSVPAIGTMTAALNKYDPSLTKNPAYNDQAVWQWVEGTIIAEAAKAGGVGTTNPITAAALLNGMYTLHTTTADGLTPTLTFTRGKAEADYCFYLAGIKNGKFDMPYGLKTTCVPQSS